MSNATKVQWCFMDISLEVSYAHNSTNTLQVKTELAVMHIRWTIAFYRRYLSNLVKLFCWCHHTIAWHCPIDSKIRRNPAKKPSEWPTINRQFCTSKNGRLSADLSMGNCNHTPSTIIQFAAFCFAGLQTKISSSTCSRDKLSFEIEPSVNSCIETVVCWH